MSGVYDSACTVRDDKLYTWTKAGPSYDIQNIPNSVDLPTTTVETMGLYIITRDAAKLTRRRIGNKPHMLHVTPEEAVDINYEVDFALANNIALKPGAMVSIAAKLICDIRFWSLRTLLTASLNKSPFDLSSSLF